MKATELRIGNAVECEGKIYYIDCGERIDNAENYNPIPLTEEWILKFGFGKSKQPNGHIFYGNRAFGMRMTKHPNRDDIFHLFGYESTVVIKHVHQLQNLYFALIGKELI
jgi:hypothetical protein